MNRPDPMRRVWDALEAAGMGPKGEVYKFSARCPAHDDRRPSLDVREGSDCRVLMFCRAGCPTEKVVAALGLRMSDLFPAGHERGYRPRPVVARALSPGEALIAALQKIGAAWSGIVSAPCAYCDHDAAWWRLSPDGVDVDCPNGCRPDQILRALDCVLDLADAGVVA